MIDFLDILKKDVYFYVGDVLILRLLGWPMGGSYSEIGTSMDLNHSINKAANSRPRREEIGMQYKDLKFSQILGGLLHVDDALVASAIWCPECLESILKKLFPYDVGIEVEEKGFILRFLSSGH